MKHNAVKLNVQGLNFSKHWRQKK